MRCQCGASGLPGPTLLPVCRNLFVTAQPCGYHRCRRNFEFPSSDKGNTAGTWRNAAGLCKPCVIR